MNTTIKPALYFHKTLANCVTRKPLHNKTFEFRKKKNKNIVMEPTFYSHRTLTPNPEPITTKRSNPRRKKKNKVT